MSCDFQRSLHSFSLSFRYGISRRNILKTYYDAWDDFQLKLFCWDRFYSKNINEGCKEFLKKNADFLVSNIEGMATNWGFVRHKKLQLVACNILLCLLNWNICKTRNPVIHQKDRETPAPSSVAFVADTFTKLNYSFTYRASNMLQKILSTLSEDEIFTAFNKYIGQMYSMKSEITEDDFCTGKIDPSIEFQLKLCYCKKLFNAKDYKRYKDFLERNADLIVKEIEKLVHEYKTKTKHISCKILLSLLNWNKCNQKTTSIPLKDQDYETSSEAEHSTKYSSISHKVRPILKMLLSTLSKDEIFTAFNEYLGLMYIMKSEITEDDFCTGKIDPSVEFQLKLCYCEKLCSNNDNDETLKEFLRKNADLFVSQIEKVVHGNKTKTKHISCKVLLFLLNWNICSLNTTFISSHIQNSEVQESCSLQMEAENTTKSACTVNKVRCVLQNLLSSLTHNDIFKVFNGYIYQMYTMKSEITPDGLCIGETETHHEFKLKLCYWETICWKNDYAAIKKFIQLYPEVLVSHIKQRIVLCQGTKTKRFYCRTLLCILNWNICTSKTAPLLVQKAEIQASSSIDESPPKYLSTAETIRNILQHSLSTFSEEEILTLFNNYIDLLYAMNSEIAEADFCTGKIEPYHEFMMKLCYCEKLGNDDDDENYRKFLRRNADFLVPQILEVFDKKNTKTKFISCQVLLCLLKWDICNWKTAYKPLKNILSQMLSQNTDCQDFMNENVLLFISMVHTVIKNNNIPVLITLRDVLLHIPYNTCHFQDVTGAINKLIRYYATQVGMDGRICEWIILFGHRLLKYTKHTQDIRNYIADCENKDGIRNYVRLNVEDRITKLWRAELTRKVKIIQISNNIRKKNKNLPFKIEENKNCLEFDYSQLNFIDTFEEEVMEDQLKVKTLEDQMKAILIIDEMVKKFQLSEMLVLLMMLLIAGTSNGHHKSAKLKKYLTLKYEYAKASLYLLWCSGDIEVHPGPSLNKKSLAHDSTIERRWIQNISPKILVLLPDHEQPKYKPTKKVRNDMENRYHFKTLLKTCLEEKVHVQKMYLAEIYAWETMEYHLLYKLFVYRCEFETVIASLQDFLTCGGSTNDLADINVSFHTELKTNEIPVIVGNNQRLQDKSQLMVYITRYIAGISIKCAHGKDPDAKCDRLWDLPLKNWPTDVILFDPNNRGKYSKKYSEQKLIPDQELVDMLLTLPQVTIPQKYKDIVDEFRTMRKSQKDKSIKKQHKAELCTTFKRITSLEKLDYSLKNLWESGLFTKEVHNNLNKWWTTGAVDTTDDQNVSQVDIIEVQKSRRPHILINISTKSITLTVQKTDANSSQVSYDFPFKDELVPLETMATTVHQTTSHKPSNDSYQKVTAKKYFTQMVTAKIHLTVSPEPDACPADNQINLIIIPPDEMTVLNSHFPCDLYPDSQAILKSDIKHQHKISTEDTALRSTIDFDQPTSSAKQISQLSQNIATPKQSITNSDDISSATIDSQSLDFHMQVSPTSDIGSSDSISSVNSKSGNEDGDQINIPNGGHVLLTDSDYSSDSSNICVSKTNMKKRKCMEEDRNEMKKRKVPSLKQDKKPKETNYRKDDSSMDKSTIFNINMELVQDCLQIDLDSFVFDDQTFDVKLNALNNEDKNPQICEKDRNLMNGETQMSNKNTTVRAYDTNVSIELEKFLQEMIYGEDEKMLQFESNLSDM